MGSDSAKESFQKNSGAKLWRGQLLDNGDEISDFIQNDKVLKAKSKFEV